MIAENIIELSEVERIICSVCMMGNERLKILTDNTCGEITEPSRLHQYKYLIAKGKYVIEMIRLPLLAQSYRRYCIFIFIRYSVQSKVVTQGHLLRFSSEVLELQI